MTRFLSLGIVLYCTRHRAASTLTAASFAFYRFYGLIDIYFKQGNRRLLVDNIPHLRNCV